jgi:hypothetical protein
MNSPFSRGDVSQAVLGGVVGGFENRRFWRMGLGLGI